MYCRAIGSFRMGVDRENLVGVTLDSEIEPPRACNAALPDIACLIVFLGSKRRMAQVFNEQGNLLAEGALDFDWSCVELAGERGAVDDAHQAWDWRLARFAPLDARSALNTSISQASLALSLYSFVESLKRVFVRPVKTACFEVIDSFRKPGLQVSIYQGLGSQ
jgi:hypothetical protein